MKLKFLGTGGVLGTPVWNCTCRSCTSTNKKNKRYRPSFMLQIEDKIIIIDFGQDFKYQLIKNRIPKIDYAFLTHNHRDHTSGSENFTICKNTIIEMPYDVLQKFSEEIGDNLVKRNKNLIIREFIPKQIEEVKIDTIKLEHKKIFKTGEVEYTPCYGYLFNSPKYKFAYMSDYSDILEPEKLYNLDLIISDGCKMENTNMGHVGVTGSIEVYNKFKPKQMILTHIHHNTEHNILQEYVRNFGKIFVAFDGMEVETDLKSLGR